MKMEDQNTNETNKVIANGSIKEEQDVYNDMEPDLNVDVAEDHETITNIQHHQDAVMVPVNQDVKHGICKISASNILTSSCSTCESGRPVQCDDAQPHHSETTTDMKTPHKNAKFQCKVCDKYFSSVDYLKVHIRIHTGEKPFQCKVCGESFTQNVYLTTHNRIHTGRKPFECKVCGKSFPRKSILTTHYLIHTGGKPYKCELCGKSFASQTNQRTHYRTHELK